MSDFTRTRACGYSILPEPQIPNPCGTPAVPGGACCPCAPSGGQKPSGGDSTGCTCCKTSMRSALKLLCCNAIADYVNFDAFAFLTDFNMVGATPASMTAGENDNLDALNGTFRRFSPCNCDMIDIAGTVMTPYGATVTVDEASLCALSAIAFQLLPAPTADTSATTAAAATTTTVCCPADTNLFRYRRVRDLLQAELQSTDRPCGECVCSCNCTDDCCCTDGVLNALSNTALNKRTTLTAGQLSLRNVTALGTIGSVLVLGNEEDSRFYFVCANKVEFLA